MVLRKLPWSLMVALKRDKRDERVLTQKHSSAHPGADHGGAARRGRGQQRISCKLLKLLTQGKPARRRKLWWGTLTPLDCVWNV